MIVSEYPKAPLPNLGNWLQEQRLLALTPGKVSKTMTQLVPTITCPTSAVESSSEDQWGRQENLLGGVSPQGKKMPTVEISPQYQQVDPTKSKSIYKKQLFYHSNPT